MHWLGVKRKSRGSSHYGSPRSSPGVDQCFPPEALSPLHPQSLAACGRARRRGGRGDRLLAQSFPGTPPSRRCRPQPSIHGVLCVDGIGACVRTAVEVSPYSIYGDPFYGRGGHVLGSIVFFQRLGRARLHESRPCSFTQRNWGLRSQVASTCIFIFHSLFTARSRRCAARTSLSITHKTCGINYLFRSHVTTYTYI